MSTKSKIVSFDAIPAMVRKEKESGNKIVQCHGTFDLIHPGHVIHFEESKGMGDTLIVTVTGEKFVNKGPGRPYFNDELRLKSLAALESVDYVAIIPYPAAVEAIEAVRPDIYCKGKEYENAKDDVTGNMADDVKTVKATGGVIRYVGSVVFSSTKLLHGNFTTQTPEVKSFCQSISQTYEPDELRSMVDSFSDLKVLVIGDIIFDEYETVQVQGLTSKNRILSGRRLYGNQQAGGALAVYRHALEFTEDIKFLSVVGKEPWIENEIRQFVSEDNDKIVRCREFTSIRKLRFVEPYKDGVELNKLFSVNYINEGEISKSTEEKVLDSLASMIQDFDLVLVMDFGHGLMTRPIREFVQEKAPFLSLNCQTNSYNHGYNVIDRQYSRADSFSLDESEIKLSCGIKKPDFPQELAKLKSVLGAKCSWLTRGSIETIGIGTDEQESRCPPFEKEVVDAVGAGDAFCTIASLAAAKGLPIDASTYLAQMAGAQAVRIIGNSEAIKKADLLKAAQTMINF
jgi:cytidyltransferase-like protein